MMRTVIRFQDDEDGTVRFFLERPTGVAEGRRLAALRSQPSDAEFRFAAPNPEVHKAGARLRDDLLSHAGVKSSLQAWLDQVDRPLQSLHLEIDSGPADSLPWESLVDSKGEFLALAANSPIARVLTADRQGDLKKEVVFTSPLRSVCVLGAWWEDGGAREQKLEWDSLEAAFHSASAQALGVDVTVFGCDTKLKAVIEGAVRPPGVTVRWQPIVGDAPTLLKSVRAARPQLLHLFAHGDAGELPFLRISSVGDVEAGQEGSILVGARDIRQDGDPDENVWVIALNACDTAATSRDARNLASLLVRFGFPAVIGMGEPVTTAEARNMSQHFHAAAIEALEQLPIGQRYEVEWAQFLQRVRTHLAGGGIAARGSKRWLLPLLYARSEPFTIIRGQAELPEEERRRLQGMLDELKTQRDTAMTFQLPEDTKIKMRADFDARIHDLEAKLV